jgi:tRNA-Thr(GGU) m(6)t(6)A37 methyltransferase TsaA
LAFTRCGNFIKTGNPGFNISDLFPHSSRIEYREARNVNSRGVLCGNRGRPASQTGNQECILKEKQFSITRKLVIIELSLRVILETGKVMELKPIGILHTSFRTKENCPIQPLYAADTLGRVEIYEQYAAELKDIESFSHIYLLYQFDRAGAVELIRPTFLDDEPHGVFATRHPCRPNRIVMSIVRVIRRDNNVLEVEGLNVLDQTPLLDIKPYIPRFDRIVDASEGWLANKEWRPKPEGRD